MMEEKDAIKTNRVRIEIGMNTSLGKMKGNNEAEILALQLHLFSVRVLLEWSSGLPAEPPAKSEVSTF